MKCTDLVQYVFNILFSFLLHFVVYIISPTFFIAAESLERLRSIKKCLTIFNYKLIN